MKLSGARAILVLSVGVCLTSPAYGQNWPSFRGPNGSGVAGPGQVPTSWDAEAPANMLWTTPLPGLGHSSPVVWGNRVFISAAVTAASPNYNPKDASTRPADDDSVHEWRLLCLDKTTGRILWSRTAHQGIPRVKRHVKATQANATPVTDGRIVVVSFGSEGLYAYDMDGTLQWQHDLGILDPGYAGQPELSWGFASSPIIHDGL